jgi:hypothetical protein
MRIDELLPVTRDDRRRRLVIADESARRSFWILGAAPVTAPFEAAGVIPDSRVISVIIHYVFFLQSILGQYCRTFLRIQQHCLVKIAMSHPPGHNHLSA